MTYDLNRFVDAQRFDYPLALSEIRNGRKQGHWMWYIFPQLKGLGYSKFSKYYAISCLDEAKAYLEHPILGANLIEICEVLLSLENPDAYMVFNSPDDMKLKSSMTLFALADAKQQVFQQVLDCYFKGAQDLKTVTLLPA